MAARLQMDPVVKGEDGKAADTLAKRLNRFQNKNTWWRHGQNGTMADFDRQFEAAVERLRKSLGKTYPLVIDGKAVKPKGTFATHSPAAKLVVGNWAAGTVEHARKAVAAAKAGFPA